MEGELVTHDNLSRIRFFALDLQKAIKDAWENIPSVMYVFLTQTYSQIIPSISSQNVTQGTKSYN